LPSLPAPDLLGHLSGTDSVLSLFSSRGVLQSWLDVERALAEAEAEVGVIPRAAADRIAREAKAEQFELSALQLAVEASDHPLVPLVRKLAEHCGEYGGWVHWGATTQDILDTALVLQSRAAVGHITPDVVRATKAAVELTRRYCRTPMAGRTHGQHAVPITFGLKTATWCDELGRAHQRLTAAVETVSRAQLSGAAGTFATLGSAADPVQREFCRRLNVAQATVHWHSTRDGFRDLCHALNEVSSTAERVAAEIIRLQSTEIGELAEPTTTEHVGSSTMPQKRNPMKCEYIVASARLLRGATSVLIDSPGHAHERDMALWAAEWIALPQALVLASGIAAKLAYVLEGLEVDEARMRANLDRTDGAIMAEAVMMALAPSMGHEQAHATVMAAARRAASESRLFAEVLGEDLDRSLAPDGLDELLDPTSYLGISEASAVTTASRVAASLTAPTASDTMSR
jgi:3-carboxy-cis,cis-muconate cycloisomerase